MFHIKTFSSLFLFYFKNRSKLKQFSILFPVQSTSKSYIITVTKEIRLPDLNAGSFRQKGGGI